MGGTLNETTCTCDCADGYSGDTCGSKCIKCYIDSCSRLLVEYDLALKHISMRIPMSHFTPTKTVSCTRCLPREWLMVQALNTMSL